MCFKVFLNKNFEKDFGKSHQPPCKAGILDKASENQFIVHIQFRPSWTFQTPGVVNTAFPTRNQSRTEERLVSTYNLNIYSLFFNKRTQMEADIETSCVENIWEYKNETTAIVKLYLPIESDNKSDYSSLHYETPDSVPYNNRVTTTGLKHLRALRRWASSPKI